MDFQLDPTAELRNEVSIMSMEQFEELRRRQLAGEPISTEEYRAVLRYLRGMRMSAAVAAPKGGKSSKAANSEAAMKALEELIG